MHGPLRVVILKPSKYLADGFVERFRWGFMPNSTAPHRRSMTPAAVGETPLEVHAVDEYVYTDLNYLSLLSRPANGLTLLALVGVQSRQFHRELDLAAYARRNGCMAVIGEPHVMTCDTSPMHGHGVSFAQAEAELVWSEILHDASCGELQPVYGRDRRWQQELQAPALTPPSHRELSRYVIPMLRVYPARGRPFLCNFCAVTKIAGRRIRSQNILCPIPGSEQYDDFMAEGLIDETNLDRFDTTCLTWRHPSLSRQRLSELLFECYRKFNSWRHALGNAKDELRLRIGGTLARTARSLAISLFTRYCAWRRMHPMSGGVRRVRRDRVADFLAMRKETFGFELAPLPRSLPLAPAESLPEPGRQRVRPSEAASGQ